MRIGRRSRQRKVAVSKFRKGIKTPYYSKYSRSLRNANKRRMHTIEHHIKSGKFTNFGDYHRNFR